MGDEEFTYSGGLMYKAHMKDQEFSTAMEPLHMQLTADQGFHYASILWLLNPDGQWGTGRSHLMAMAFIEHSLMHDQWVRVFDHDAHSPIHMVEKCVGIVKDSLPGLKIKHTGYLIKVERIQK